MILRFGKKKEEMKIKLVGEISKLDDIFIIYDGWISINIESFCIVISYYINKNWEMCSVVFEIKKVIGSYIVENIKNLLIEIKNIWKLLEFIVVIDNVVNERKVFDLFEWCRFGCYGYSINLIVKNVLVLFELLKVIVIGRKLVIFFY